MKQISLKTIERLINYRRALYQLRAERKESVFSHQIAVRTGASSAQVRRDLMAIGYSGSPAHGYDLELLLQSISEFIDADEMQKIAVAGVGKLGRAIIDYLRGRHPTLKISAVFDIDPEKVNRVLHGCRCYRLDQITEIVSEQQIQVAILAVPAAVAQDVAEHLVAAGVRGIINYAPVLLYLPANIYIENRDMITAIEKTAYLARQLQKKGSK
ncbi:redox-sensing transcriptional repressor Rex [bacterium]|nr:redox-sensing transcriptional repressor Rex [bacterium]